MTITLTARFSNDFSMFALLFALLMALGALVAGDLFLAIVAVITVLSSLPLLRVDTTPKYIAVSSRTLNHVARCEALRR